jgi:hypothetical protein
MRVTKDTAAMLLVKAAAPAIRRVARQRANIPGAQDFLDGAGFQLRTDHYYEPTYSAQHLPAETAVERSLPGVDFNEAEQLALLAQFTFADELANIPVRKPSDASFGYDNDMYSYGDAEIYYGMIRRLKPRRIIEIGSGNSTLMAGLAVDANRSEDPAYTCDRTCIEPYEMPWLESTGVTVVRERVETVDLAMFDTLEAGDILFIDSSHVIRPWGDVLREFQEIVPRVKRGVFVHVHDIFTPRDYPESWLRHRRHLWNEQYLLESFLAFNGAFKIACSVNWLKHNHWTALTAACPMLAKHPQAEPGAFWFKRV